MANIESLLIGVHPEVASFSCFLIPPQHPPPPPPHTHTHTHARTETNTINAGLQKYGKVLVRHIITRTIMDQATHREMMDKKGGRRTPTE